jgi:hypothetical protein
LNNWAACNEFTSKKGIQETGRSKQHDLRSIFAKWMVWIDKSKPRFWSNVN